MNIVTALFSVARQISDGNLDEVNKLEEKANSDVAKYHTGMKGIKGWIAKSRESWIFFFGINICYTFCNRMVS